MLRTPMGPQALYNSIKAHLLTQRAQALDSSQTCVYRTEAGLTCAVGCLIPEDLYGPECEQKSISWLFQHGYLPEVDYSKANLKLLEALQQVHDYDNPTEWPAALAECAQAHNLKP